MKTPIRIAFAALLLAAMSLLPAFAQETVGTLQVNGTVMTSTGGEFVPAADGQAVAEGTRLMVSEGSSASITFPNGAVVNFTQPGVYTINMPAAGSLAAGSTVNASSIIASNAAFITSPRSSLRPASPPARWTTTRSCWSPPAAEKPLVEPTHGRLTPKGPHSHAAFFSSVSFVISPFTQACL